MTYLNAKKPATTSKNLDDAYQLAIKNIGLDVQSFKVWQGYIEHLEYVTTTSSTKETAATIDQNFIKETYMKALQIPMINIEILWSEFCSFVKKFAFFH